MLASDAELGHHGGPLADQVQVLDALTRHAQLVQILLGLTHDHAALHRALG
jgi:hypothetical protein